jgi:thioredoxin 1
MASTSIISFRDALETAEKGNKPLFVFVHASWCPTCKKMENEIFTENVLGNYYNNKLVCDAIDFDSREGKKLNKMFPVTATPTLLFFSAKGKLEKKLEGFTAARDLLDLAETLKN